MIEKIYARLKDERVREAVAVQSEIRREIAEFLYRKKFVEIPPVIISPLTDPLHHETYNASVDYYGYKYSLTRSMIFHKQISLLSHEKIFSFSPNIRLEPLERKYTGRHLAEFTQVDIEIKNAKRDDIMKLVEDMLVQIFKKVRKRDLKIPTKPFKRIRYEDAYSEYGNEFEIRLSEDVDEPFWLIDIPIQEREFYDREYKDRILKDMDLIYPEGYGEAASGGEREYEYEKILERIQRGGYRVEDFEIYLEFVKRGLPSSAGIGIGIERLTRYIRGLENIEDATLFPKIIGEFGI